MTQPRHEPLDHLALAGRATGNAESAAVVLRALPYHPSLILRGESDDPAFLEGFLGATGFGLPIAPFGITNQNDCAACWLGPNEWLIIGVKTPEHLAAGLAGCRHALIRIGDGQQIIAITGARAVDVLTKHCPLDLHDLKRSQPWCSRTVLAGIQIILRNLYDGSYRVHVGRSLADYTWRILEDAALEFDVVVAVGS